MSDGFGHCPFGNAGFGFGTPNTTTARAGTTMADSEGVVQGSRFIDPATRQYTFDTNGRTVGQDNIQHLVWLRIATIKGSSAWDGGLRGPGGVLGANYVQRIESDVREALNDLVAARYIEIETIDISRPKPSRIDLVIQWRDLGNGRSLSTELNL